MKFDPICDWNEISFPKTRAIESIKTKSYAKTKLDSFGKLSIGHGKSLDKVCLLPYYYAFVVQAYSNHGCDQDTFFFPL